MIKYLRAHPYWMQSNSICKVDIVLLLLSFASEQFLDFSITLDLIAAYIEFCTL